MEGEGVRLGRRQKEVGVEGGRKRVGEREIE